MLCQKYYAKFLTKMKQDLLEKLFKTLAPSKKVQEIRREQDKKLYEILKKLNQTFSKKNI